MQIQDMNYAEFLEFVEEHISKMPKITSGMSVNFPYDLRESLAMKKSNCSDFHKWTAFINNAGTLCHVIAPEADILIRVSFYYTVKHLSKDRQHKIIMEQIKNWVNI